MFLPFTQFEVYTYIQIPVAVRVWSYFIPSY